MDAIGLALSMPPWPLARAYVGSDARALAAYLPVSMAMQACDAAAEGMAGAPDIIEHAEGFLAQFAQVPLPESVTAGLGARWHTDTLSFKVRPCGPGIDAAVDCAVELHEELPGLRPADVSAIDVAASAYTIAVDKIVTGYADGPDTVVGALPLSLSYTVATALLTGGLSVADFAPPAVSQGDRWSLAAKVTLRHDSSMTSDLLTSDAPFGEAIRQAGDRALPWLDRFAGRPGEAARAWPDGRPAPPACTFEHAVKRTGARVEVRLADGRRLARERSIPVGAAGPETRSAHASLVRAKFLASGGGERTADGLARLGRASASEVAALLASCLDFSAGGGAGGGEVPE